MGEPYAGNSGTHTTRGNAVDTTNGAGAHNIQMFIMNPDGTVLHCLPGYWNPRDLAGELQFAQKLNDLYLNQSLSPVEKKTAYSRMQLDHVHMHSSDMVARSQLQHFDMKHEAMNPHSDAVKNRALLADGQWGPAQYAAFKTTDEILHERMAARPFLTYDKFDVARFADYGTSTYDKHEDSLDETGRKVADDEFKPIKNHNTLAAFHSVKVGPHRQAAPKVYVKTYGKVRQNTPPVQAGSM